MAKKSETRRSKPLGPNGKRPLRTPNEVRDLILQAARSCFAESGYAGTTTRQIAARAGVVENLIFKRFGNKAALFEAAVVEPFRAALDELKSRWAGSAHGPLHGEDMAREYVEQLYDLLEGHAELLLAMMADRRQDHPLLPLMQELERIGAREVKRQGWHGTNIRVLARLHFGMVAFNAAFGEALYGPTEDTPSREQVIDEMTAFLVHGTADRPV